ncbi:hypothetical protein ACF06X_33795 [Streptomyces sp. NPDC015346]|uniref:hypothetical protein n=1 Tax=Streptomyces sp. NPDC015346 TaxID=3364954 RepID=UPI0036F65BDA
MTDKTPAQHADTAAEAIRAINHLTMSPRDGFQYPGDVYSLVADLSRMAMMLPQALEQASRLIDDLNAAGHLRSDKDQLEHDLQNTFMGLEQARVAAEQLYGGLNRAHNGLGPIGYKD